MNMNHETLGKTMEPRPIHRETFESIRRALFRNLSSIVKSHILENEPIIIENVFLMPDQLAFIDIDPPKDVRICTKDNHSFRLPLNLMVRFVASKSRREEVVLLEKLYADFVEQEAHYRKTEREKRLKELREIDTDDVSYFDW